MTRSRTPAAGRPELRYTLLAPLRTDQAHFTFDGPFEGRTVTWDARLMTLGYAAGSIPGAHRPFIEIGATTSIGRALTVALDIPQIDEPAILRTIIMIRQYKRLRRGRHEFGTLPETDPAA